MISRARMHTLLSVARPGDRASRAVDVGIVALILLSVTFVMGETIPSLWDSYRLFFRVEEIVLTGLFLVEYLLRLWSCVEDPRYASPIRGRVRYALRPMMVVDLLAILPSLLTLGGLDLRALRALRLLRVARLLKLGRYSQAEETIANVVRDRGPELVIVIGIVAMLIIVSATLMYYAEHEAQPEVFASIPHAVWWSVVTLTTIGYGDVYPVTTLGRFMGSVIAILGIGMVALPAGILGAGFTDEIAKRRKQKQGVFDAETEAITGVCPACGRAHEPLRDGSP